MVGDLRESPTSVLQPAEMRESRHSKLLRNKLEVCLLDGSCDTRYGEASSNRLLDGEAAIC